MHQETAFFIVTAVGILNLTRNYSSTLTRTKDKRQYKPTQHTGIYGAIH
jgi:hypothetical protein